MGKGKPFLFIYVNTTTHKLKQINIMKTRKTFKTGEMGTTKNYKLFKHLKFNRGRKNSIDRKRVDAIKQMIKDGVYFDVAIVVINVFGIIIDGNHTFVALSELGMDIPYMVSKDLQTTDDKKLVMAISRINAHNSKWRKTETSNTAKMCGFPLALRVNEIVETISQFTNIKVNKIMESWVFALIHRDAKYFYQSKELDLVEAFDNDDALAKATDESFDEVLDLYIDIVERVKHIGSRFNNASEHILKLVWENSIFDIERFLNNVDKYGFNPNTDSKGDVKIEIQRVYNAGKGRLNTYFKLYRSVMQDRNSTNVIKAYLLKNN